MSFFFFYDFVLYTLLRRISCPCRYGDTIQRFARPVTVLSMITNTVPAGFTASLSMLDHYENDYDKMT